MITFVLGRSGTGKTRRMLDEVRRELLRRPDGPPVVILVPDQATFQVEQALLATREVRGTTRAQVLSFRRLAARVFEFAGVPRREPLIEVGRHLLLRRAYARVGSEMTALPTSPGTSEIAQVGRVLFELVRHAQTPELLRALGEAASEPELRSKLRDLGRLLEAYLAESTTHRRDPDRVLTEMLEVLEGSDFLAGALVWIDGFASLNGQERRVLRALARRTEHMTVALLLDPASTSAAGGEPEIDPQRLFRPVEVTYRRLLNDFLDEGVTVGEPVHLDDSSRRFGAGTALHRLEERIFRLPAAAPGVPGDVKDAAAPPQDPPPTDGAIELVACPTARHEAEFAVTKVLELVTDRGLCFRDIAIIVRDLGPWHDMLSAYLAEHGIPFFIDRRRSLGHHAFVELLETLGDMLADDFAPSTMRRFLKTALTGLSRYGADILENHVLRCGIRGATWWAERADPGVREVLGERPPAREVERAERLRLGVARRLLAWRGFRRGTATGAEWARRLYAVVLRLGALMRLNRWSLAAERAGDLAVAREHQQVANQFITLLDEVVHTSGDELFTAREFFRLLDLGLGAWDIGLTPPRLDQVLVGSIERSRHPELTAVLLLGFNEGSFPRLAREDPLLNDRDRSFLVEHGYGGERGSRESIMEDRLLAYIAMTRASRYLYISYAETGPDGRPNFPSSFVAEVCAVIPGLEAQRRSDTLLLASTPERVAEGALRAANAPDGERARWAALVRACREDPALRERLTLIRRSAAVAEVTETLDVEPAPEGVDAAPPRTVGVTELETYAQCPFRHFAQHTLGLREREEAGFGYLELGVLRHRVLEEIARELMAEGVAFHATNAAGDRARVAQAVATALGRTGRRVVAADPLVEYLSKRLETDLAEFLACRRAVELPGKWRALAAELSFSESGALSVLPFEIRGRRFAVKGTIDRIDVAGDGRTLCIYDFKGRVDFHLDEVYHGLSLQLPLYMKALARGGSRLVDPTAAAGDVSVVGALLHGTRSGLRSTDGPEDPSGIPPGLKPRGLLSLTGLSHIDPDLFGGSGRSSLVSGMLKKDGSLGNRGSSDVLYEAELALLLEHVERKVLVALSGMAAGRIGPRPAVHRHTTACSRCDFASFCRFEPFIDGERYRPLPALGADEVVGRIVEGAKARRVLDGEETLGRKRKEEEDRVRARLGVEPSEEKKVKKTAGGTRSTGARGMSKPKRERG